MPDKKLDLKQVKRRISEVLSIKQAEIKVIFDQEDPRFQFQAEKPYLLMEEIEKILNLAKEEYLDLTFFQSREEGVIRVVLKTGDVSIIMPDPLPF